MAKAEKLASTQEHLDLEDIRDDIVLTKNSNACAVLQTTAVNFDLLSEAEQDAMIFAFAALLNSLTFPIQILIRTKRMDITNYLSRVQAAKKRTHNESLLIQIEKYEKFIKDLVSKNQVLDKRFYVVVPYIGLDLSQVTSSLSSLLGRRPKKIGKWTVLEKAKVNLEPKVEHLTKQFSRVGVKAIRLNTEELVELFYDLYNPELAREEKAAIGPREYTTPIVEPSLIPEPIQAEGEESPAQEQRPGAIQKQELPSQPSGPGEGSAPEQPPLPLEQPTQAEQSQPMAPQEPPPTPVPSGKSGQNQIGEQEQPTQAETNSSALPPMETNKSIEEK